MKFRLILSLVVFTIIFSVFSAGSQVTTTNIDAGTFVIVLAGGSKLNDGSTLHRSWLVLNDSSCPVQLLPTGSTNDDLYYCHLQGTFKVTSPVQSYAVNYLLFNSLNDQIKTRSVTLTSDYNPSQSYDLPFLFNQTEGTLTCVLFVSRARTTDGSVWRFNQDQITKSVSSARLQIKSLEP